MGCLGLDSIYFRARQLGPAFGGGAWRLTVVPTLIWVAHPALPSLKLKDAIWKSLDSKRRPSSSRNLTLFQFYTPWSNHLSTTPWNCWPSLGFRARRDTILLNSPSWRDSHFSCLSLLKKETHFLSNGIQQFKKKKSIELCFFLWSLGKADLGFDSVKTRNLPCSVKSEIGSVSLFFFFLSFFKPSGARTDKGAASDSGHLKHSQRLHRPGAHPWVLGFSAISYRKCQEAPLTSSSMMGQRCAWQIRGSSLLMRHCHSKGLGCLMEGTSRDPASKLPCDLEQVTEHLRPVSQL